MLPKEKAPLIRVIDDESEVREALKFLLTCEGYRVVVYESALKFLTEDSPDDFGCIVADVRMPGINGIDLFERLREIEYPIPLIFLSGHGDIDMAVKAVLDGAIDFIQKPIVPERVFKAIARGIQRCSLKSINPYFSEENELRRRYDSLTSREKQVLKLVSSGLTNKEIAERLNLSHRTVEGFRLLGLKKLEIKKPAEVLAVFNLLKT